MSIPPICILTLAGVISTCFAMRENAKPVQPPVASVNTSLLRAPFVILQQGDTTWVRPCTDPTSCPGDPLVGHGGEATGGPDGSETWCFEQGPGDTCGTEPPWDILCFDHEDVRALASPTGINYWHIDDHRTYEAPYCGTYCLWCGSDSIWVGDALPVECGTWTPGKYPGYGDLWNCNVQLDLDSTFSVATGCTLYFDPRYDTECKADYFYVDFYDYERSAWLTLAIFNASSDNPGSECGPATGGNPDYWGNTNLGQPNSASWQTRSNPGEPAFAMAIHDTLIDEVTSAPSFRWRFISDGAWSDADFLGDTDGACFIDNVWVVGDPGSRYEEDFEHGSWDTLEARGWSKPDPDGIAQGWHLVHDVDPPYEGADGGDRTTCNLDSSVVWRARPDGGFPGGAAWRNGWFYRLKSPAVPITNTGCVVQYDQYMCALDYTCDYTDTRVRFYDSVQGKWCPWINIDGELLYGGCVLWNFDREEDVTHLYGPAADSMQFAWELVDISIPTGACRGKHKLTDNIIDNVSIGFFDGNATMFSARPIDLLHDTFHDSIAAHNSSFKAYKADTIAFYSQPVPPPLPRDKQLNIDAVDKDGLQSVELWGSIDRGAGWQTVSMNLSDPLLPDKPGLGGTYYGTLDHTDFGYPAAWPGGVEVWYYVVAVDSLSDSEYFPTSANPSHSTHTGSRDDYLSFSILPSYPDDYEGPKLLLVDGGGATSLHDWSPCIQNLGNVSSGMEHGLEDFYEQALIDAGYCYDKFDVLGAGSNVHIHCIWLDHYDAIIWITGPGFTQYLFDKEAQDSIEAYLAAGGKLVLSGDGLATGMVWPCDIGVCGEDSLNGRFYNGIMGASYLDQMESPFYKPYVSLGAVETVNVLGSPVEIELDSLLLYRGCPGLLREMAYVCTSSSPGLDYTNHRLLKMRNPDPLYDDAVGAIYTESHGVGQCVFLNFDLAAMINHDTQYCDGSTTDPVPPFAPGVYDGRVELMRVILEDLFGLPSNGPGGGGTGGVTDGVTYRWGLAQNRPNPFTSGTEIKFEIAHTTDVGIKVYNTRGQLVRTLEKGRMKPGRYSARWDGTNDAGKGVSAGVYFYKMQAGNFSDTYKMLLVR
jgi:hypothetical protein